MAGDSVKYTLWGFGFNGFGQLCSQIPGDAAISCEARSGRAANDEERRVDAERQGRDCHSEVAIYSPRKLMEFYFSSKPSLHCSAAWDALHIHVCEDRKDGLAAQDKGHSISMTTGRWVVALEEVKQRLKKEDLVCVLEEKGVLLLQTTTRTLIAKQDPREGSWHLTECELSNVNGLASLSDGSLFIHLEPGNVHRFSIETHGKTHSLKLGPQINVGVKVTGLSCGTDHVLLLAANGDTYSLGLGSRGQLGHGDVLPRKDPCLIEALAGIAMREVTGGSWHSLALSEYGDVYSWGWNEHGQLGHSTEANTPVMPLPKVIDTAEDDLNFVSIACGSRHSAAVTDSGLLYTWGWNGYGQLGHGGTVTQPSGICFPDANVRLVAMAVCCGQWNSIVLGTCIDECA